MRILTYSLALLLLVPMHGVAKREQVLEEVVVVAKQPGPKLWRITHGANELWILGVLRPLPKDLDWDSSSVEAVLADADEIIKEPGIGVSANPVKLLFVAPSLWGIRKNPGNKKLIDVLPADLYERWLALKEVYIGKDKGIEKHRPIIAAQELYRRAVEQSGLTHSSDIYKIIDKAQKKHKIADTSTSLKRHLKSPRSAIKKFKKSEISDIECFRKTIERVEVDLEIMKSRAAAWAAGDVAAIRALPFEDQNVACIDAVMASSFAGEMEDELDLGDVEEVLRQKWLSAARLALENNAVSFATLPIEQLLAADGYVETLRAEGYAVRGG